MAKTSANEQTLELDMARIKAVLWSCTIVFVLGVGAYLFSKYMPELNTASVLKFNQGRNYDQTPFDELDALQICQFQTKDTHGENLVLAYLDSHSSRFESASGVYKVFLFARIGKPKEYEEAVIHCHINPHKHLIEHYKTVYPEKRSLMSRALKFFTE